MILEIVRFGTPVLRTKGEKIDSVTPAIKKLMADMFETTYAHKGIGLAAQQVGLAVQLTVIDVRGVTDRPSSLELDDQPADAHVFHAAGVNRSRNKTCRKSCRRARRLFKLS